MDEVMKTEIKAFIEEALKKQDEIINNSLVWCVHRTFSKGQRLAEAVILEDVEDDNKERPKIKLLSKKIEIEEQENEQRKEKIKAKKAAAKNENARQPQVKRVKSSDGEKADTADKEKEGTRKTTAEKRPKAKYDPNILIPKFMRLQKNPRKEEKERYIATFKQHIQETPTSQERQQTRMNNEQPTESQENSQHDNQQDEGSQDPQHLIKPADESQDQQNVKPPEESQPLQQPQDSSLYEDCLLLGLLADIACSSREGPADLQGSMLEISLEKFKEYVQLPNTIAEAMFLKASALLERHEVIAAPGCENVYIVSSEEQPTEPQVILMKQGGIKCDRRCPDTQIPFYDEDSEILVSTASPISSIINRPTSLITKEQIPSLDDFNVYKEDGTCVTSKKRKLTQHQQEIQASTPKDKVRGKRYQKRCENSFEAAKSRSNHINGLISKMRDLKFRTDDDTLIEHHRHFPNRPPQIIRYATNKHLFNADYNQTTKNMYDEPTLQELEASSPSRARKRKMNVCQLCGIVENSKRDQDWDSKWIGCQYPKCEVWHHMKCSGITMPRAVKSVTWTCPMHTPRPPPASPTKKKKTKPSKKK
ncbi:uncharacterized protein [Clytia hemisphaerica]|uniref:uncharacterized protein n=1 Tax=Clytia hemisphaerica TaxID=252671 RepID=UPI0034D5700C